MSQQNNTDNQDAGDGQDDETVKTQGQAKQQHAEKPSTNNEKKEDNNDPSPLEAVSDSKIAETEFETWLASKEINLGEYKDQLAGFTVALFGSYPDKQAFKSQLLDQIKLKNKLIDAPKFYVAYDAATKLSEQQLNGM